MTSTTSSEFFEAKYQANEDPWNFSGSSYEIGRFQAILNLMGNRSYRVAFEPGCSVGVLTRMLSARCGRIEAYDLSFTAVERAARRCAAMDNVHLFRASMQHIIPAGADLYLLCEVGYYLPQAELAALLIRHVAGLSPGATVIGCHWLGSSVDHMIDGDEVHAVIGQTPTLLHQSGERHEGFRLDRWTRQEKKP